MIPFGETPSGITSATPIRQGAAITLDIHADRYHADDLGADRPTLSASIAHTLVTASPWHAWAEHPKLNPEFERVDDDKFDLGTIVHAVLVEGSDDIVQVVDADSWRTNAAKEQRDEARAAGRVPILTGHWSRVARMVKAANKQLDAAKLEFPSDPRPFTGGDPEVTLLFELDGVLCRCRIDWLHTGSRFVSDFKSTGASAHPEVWPRTAYGIGADIQVALYTEGVKAVHGIEPVWRYVVQETYPPFALSIVEPSGEFLELGRDRLRVALEKWRVCLASGEWPGYPAGVHRISPPGWAVAQWLEGGAGA